MKLSSADSLIWFASSLSRVVSEPRMLPVRLGAWLVTCSCSERSGASNVVDSRGVTMLRLGYTTRTLCGLRAGLDRSSWSMVLWTILVRWVGLR